LDFLLLKASTRQRASCQDLFPVILTSEKKTPWLYGRFNQSRLNVSRGRCGSWESLRVKLFTPTAKGTTDRLFLGLVIK
jgi:hypothetical protein